MITKSGYVVTSEEDYYKQIVEAMKTEFPNMSENPSNLAIILARVWARNENARDYDIVERYSYAYVSTATGQHLNKAVRTAGISRLIGRRAVGKVVISKDPKVSQIILSANTTLKSNDLQYITTNESAVIINTDTYEIEIESIESGSRFNIPKGSKFNTLQSLSGVKDIVANTDIASGTDTETDEALRERYYSRISGYSNSSLRGIIDRVRAINNVIRASGDENSEDTTVGGLLPHSIIIYAEGGTDTEVAQAIMDSKPAGIRTNGDISVDIDLDGKKHTVKFSRYISQNVYYKIEVVVDKTIASPTFVENLKEKIIDFTSKNSKIISYELSNELSQSVVEIKGIKSLKFGLTPNPTTNNDLTAPAGKIFFTDKSKIEVVVL